MMPVPGTCVKIMNILTNGSVFITIASDFMSALALLVFTIMRAFNDSSLAYALEMSGL